MTKLLLYDTTLRCGKLGENKFSTFEGKLSFIKQLDLAGVQLVDGGWPAVKESVRNLFDYFSVNKLENARLVACSFLRSPDVECERDKDIMRVLKSDAPVVNIFGNLGDAGVMSMLGISEDRYIIMVGETIRFFKRNGRSVIYSAEKFLHGYKENPFYALRVIKTAINSGVDCVVFCDTSKSRWTGGVIEIYQEIISKLKKLQEEKAVCGTPCFSVSSTHIADDVADSAVKAGARLVEGTVDGSSGAKLSKWISAN